MRTYELFLKNDYVAAHNALVLKAESVVDKNEWINKLQKVIQARGGQVGNVSMRQSFSDGSLVSHHAQPFLLNHLSFLFSFLKIYASYVHWSYAIPDVTTLVMFFDELKRLLEE